MDYKLLDPDWLLEMGNRIMAQRRSADYICVASERAIPLASVCALLGAPSFYRRDSAKAHGNKRQYEGAAAPRGASVAVVGLDDGSARIAQRELLDMGYEVVGAFVIQSVHNEISPLAPTNGDNANNWNGVAANAEYHTQRA